jgi:hypothetical protein
MGKWCKTPKWIIAESALRVAEAWVECVGLILFDFI